MVETRTFCSRSLEGQTFHPIMLGGKSLPILVILERKGLGVQLVRKCVRSAMERTLPTNAHISPRTEMTTLMVQYILSRTK